MYGRLTSCVCTNRVCTNNGHVLLPHNTCPFPLHLSSHPCMCTLECAPPERRCWSCLLVKLALRPFLVLSPLGARPRRGDAGGRVLPRLQHRGHVLQLLGQAGATAAGAQQGRGHQILCPHRCDVCGERATWCAKMEGSAAGNGHRVSLPPPTVTSRHIQGGQPSRCCRDGAAAA